MFSRVIFVARYVVCFIENISGVECQVFVRGWVGLGLVMKKWAHNRVV